jgi:peroxiredoxin
MRKLKCTFQQRRLSASREITIEPEALFNAYLIILCSATKAKVRLWGSCSGLRRIEYFTDVKMMRSNTSPSKVPDVRLGFMQEGEVRSIAARELFAEGRSVVLGIPGAFTPICTARHVPDFASKARRFQALGCRQLVCIAPNDPFVVEAWVRTVDPTGQVRFFADGNLDFTRTLGLTCVSPELFIGVRSERYLMIVEDGTIVRLRVEPNISIYSCSAADAALEAIDTLDILMV